MKAWRKIGQQLGEQFKKDITAHTKEMDTLGTDVMIHDMANAKAWGCDTTCITESKCDRSW
jgi:hypothetical protein